MALLFWAWLSFIKQFNVGCNWGSISLDNSEDSVNHDSELSQTRGDGATALLTYSLPPRIGWGLFPGFFHSWHFQFTLHVSRWSSSAQRAPSDRVTGKSQGLWREAMSRSHFPKMVQQCLQPTFSFALWMQSVFTAGRGSTWIQSTMFLNCSQANLEDN